MKFTSGEKYVGEWDDLRNGQGTNTWSNGFEYTGDWKEGKRSGQGTLKMPNGEKYVGEWSDDKRNGYGTLYNPDGTVSKQGQWKDGEFVE